MYDIDFDTDITELLKQEESNKIVHYPLDLTIKSASGSYLIDTNNKKYLDLTSNRECNPLGYSFANQTDNGFLFDSELFKTTDSCELENALKVQTGLNKAIFTSSKSESYSIYKNLATEYLDMLSKNKILISSTLDKRENYDLNNVDSDFIPLNNDVIATTVLTKAVGAVVVDLVQISDEISIATTEFLTILRKFCDKNKALLVFDASSVSPLRTLRGLFNYDAQAVKPDILIISNAVAQGIPFGAVILSDKLSDISSTGATILAYKSALKFISECTNNEALNIINNNVLYLEKSLNDLAARFITIADVISYGMMFTIVLDISAFDFVQEALDKGIILEAINSNTIKLSPPFNISKEEIDKLMFGFEEILDKLAKYDRLM